MSFARQLLGRSLHLPLADFCLRCQLSYALCLQAAAASRDFYKILGVSRNVDDGALKSAYRKLARKFHPDRYTDPDEKKKVDSAGQAAVSKLK